MMRWLLATALVLAARIVSAEGAVPVAARTLAPGTTIAPADLRVAAFEDTGATLRSDELVGMRTTVAVYRGRPFRPGDVAPPAVVARNALVRLIFRRGGIAITVDGRALGEAAVGEGVQVMNLASRTIVTGTALSDGTVRVGG